MGKKSRRKSSTKESKRLSERKKKERKQNKKLLKKENMVVKPTPKVKLVAVYGTLLSKCHNNRCLDDAKFVGEFWSEPIYQMYSTASKAFPYLLKGGSTSVKMEIYSFTDNGTEEGLDRLEGVSSGLYDKGSIQTPSGEAILYIKKTKFGDKDPQIVMGDWKDFRKTSKL
jgi:gamma-glutamylcyclotransferase (GGCT)/AIG2-like uncharacterized protein YtfP|tara:strand:+ start:4866 stop:5375 length:510 start_codon:yes stop_codon:yes gene_type:complete